MAIQPVCTGALALILGSLSCGAASAVAVAGEEPVPASLLACAGLPDSVQRLACFDHEISRLSQSSRPGSPAAQWPTSPPAPAARERSAATATAASVASRDAAPVPSEMRHIKARVERVQVDGANLLLLSLDNHQSWRQDREAPAELHIRVGDVISIDRELGGYYLSDRLGTTVRVRRIDP